MIEFRGCKLYKGEQLSGTWTITRKIDGVRAKLTREGCYSRNGKPLYNLDKFVIDEPQDVEIYCGDWAKTITAVRTQKVEQEIFQENIYSLDPLDSRLFICDANDPSSDFIKHLLESVVGQGDEGLVLRQGNKWLKVKPSETYDVAVTGIQPGTGRNKGRLGAFLTDMGKVGTGLTDAHRIEYNTDKMIGVIIEVECMELTPDGKFRHPRFIRVRYDK